MNPRIRIRLHGIEIQMGLPGLLPTFPATSYQVDFMRIYYRSLSFPTIAVYARGGIVIDVYND